MNSFYRLDVPGHGPPDITMSYKPKIGAFLEYYAVPFRL